MRNKLDAVTDETYALLKLIERQRRKLERAILKELQG